MIRAGSPPARAPALGRRALLALALGALGGCVRGTLEADLADAGGALERGRAALRAGDPDLAAEWFARAGALDPENALAPALEGETLYRLGRLRQAEGPLRRAVELDPTLASAWNNLGLLLMDSGRNAEAVRALRIAFGLDSGATDAIRRNLAAAMAAADEAPYARPSSRTVVPTLAPAGDIPARP